MEKKAKIIATLGPAIYSENKLKKLVELGVDAFRINFSHNTNGIRRIISSIRRIEKKNGKKLSLIAAFRPPQSPPLVKIPIFLLLI